MYDKLKNKYNKINEVNQKNKYDYKILYDELKNNYKSCIQNKEIKNIKFKNE